MGTKKSEARSVVVFGGAGFIGSNWTERLLKTTTARVHVFDNLSRSGASHNLEELQETARGSGRLQITIGDVRDAALVNRVVAGAAEIYHFAAQVAVTTSLLDPRLDFDVNLGGTFNILEAAREQGRRPFMLFTSTNKVYGDSVGGPLSIHGNRYVAANGRGSDEHQPLDFYSPYGCSKGAADQYVRDYARIFGLRSVVFRMSCIAGPRQFGSADQGWVAHFLYSALEGRPLTIYGDGRQVRDVLYVGDLLNAFEAAYTARDMTAGQIYNIGGGAENSVSLLELIEHVAKITGERPVYDFDGQRAGDQLFYVTDHSKFSRDTGWRPRTGVEGILESIYRWYRSHSHLIASPADEAGVEQAARLAPVSRSA